MAINVETSGVFGGCYVETGRLHIPLTSIGYAGGTITADEATGDYRKLLRGVHETYYNFMTGVATGDADPEDFNKPSYFTEARSAPSVVDSSKLKRSYTSSFWYDLADPLDLPLEPE